MREKLERSSNLRARHPGQILRLEVMEPSNISITGLAKALGVSTSTVSRVINEKAAISAEFAQRLELCFGASAEFWLSLQSKFDLWQARRNQPDVMPINITSSSLDHHGIASLTRLKPVSTNLKNKAHTHGSTQQSRGKSTARHQL